jgi:hypothetical protein
VFEDMGLRRIFGPETWGKRPLEDPGIDGGKVLL